MGFPTRSAKADLMSQLAEMTQHHRVRFSFEGKDPLFDPPEGSWNYVCTCEDCQHDVYVNGDYSCVVISDERSFKFAAHPHVAPDQDFQNHWEVLRDGVADLADDDEDDDA